MDLRNEVSNFMERNGIDLKNQTIVIGVSCGVDSMCLLHILEENKEKYGYNIVIAHVNHKKRNQSEEEEEFIKSYCTAHKLPIYVLHFEKEDLKKASFQENARNKRLDFFNSVCKEVKARYLALAHHLNDDIETMIFHLLRQSSLSGLGGINEVGRYKDMIIIRPFLRVLKDELYQYASNNEIKYYTDKTNSEDDYSRNRIRHYIVSQFFKENPSFDVSYLSFKEKILYASKLMDKKRDEIIKKLFIISDSDASFKISDFLNLDLVMQKEVLFEVLKKYQLSSNNINEIIKYISSSKPSLIINYCNLCFIKEYDKMTIAYQEYKHESILIKIDSIGRYYLNDEYDLEISELSKDDKKSQNTISNINLIWYNSNKFPFIIRNRIDGDKLLLPSGTKKIKDLLIDEHISLKKRDNVLLLIDKDNNIISVLGLKKSQILTNSKENDLKIELITKRGEEND